MFKFKNIHKFSCIVFFVLLCLITACRKDQPNALEGRKIDRHIQKTLINENVEVLSKSLLVAHQKITEKAKKERGTQRSNTLAVSPINKVILENAGRGHDGYNFITFNRLIEKLNEEGIDLLSLMEEETGDGAIAEILNNATDLGDYNYHIVVPSMEKLLGRETEYKPIKVSESELETIGYKIPSIGLAGPGVKEFPLEGFHFEEEEDEETSSIIVSPVIIPENPCDDPENPPAWFDCDFSFLILVAYNPINICLRSNPCAEIKDITVCGLSGPNICDDCIEEPVPESIPDGNDNGGQNNEISIDLGNISEGSSNFCIAPFFCFTNADLLENFMEGQSNYALLKSHPNVFNYYRRFGEINGISSFSTIKKVLYPIIDTGEDDTEFIEGTQLTLCESSNSLYSYIEALGFGARFGLAHGGVYTVKRLNLPDLHFAFPYGSGIWFNQGPDMTVRHHFNQEDQSCDDLMDNVTDVSPDYHTGFCEFCTYGLNYLSLSKEIIITTDFNVIKNYWNANEIDIGFIHLPSSPLQNIVTVGISSLPEPNNLGELIATLDKPAYDEFEIKEELSTVLFPGDEVIIHVEATFEPGPISGITQSISTYLNYTIQGDNSIPYVGTIIRGKIKNYLIEVYLAE